VKNSYRGSHRHSAKDIATLSKKKMPTVTMNAEGGYSIEVAPKCFLTWHMKHHGGEEHWIIDVITPLNVPVHEVYNGYSFIRPSRH
jgi:hypothetical protein